MNEKITKEKFKKFNELKNENELKFNVKNVSLMKKQLFSLMMAFALVMGLSVGAWAQDGLAPSTVKWVIKGSTSTFSVPVIGTNTYSWSVLEHAFTDLNIGIDEGSTTVVSSGTPKVTIGTASAASTTVKFFDAPASGNMFAVQVVETNSFNVCTSIRRFYINVFDFDVDVALVSNAAGADQNFDANETPYCNSWSGLVINNTHDAAELRAMHADYEVNPVNDSLKYTTSYYAVTFSLSNAPGSVTIADYKWRFQYSMPGATNLSLYEITSLTSGAVFSTAPVAADATSAVTLTGWADGTFTGNNAVYVAAAATTTYIFRVRTHNLMDQTAPMVYDLRIDQVQLETTGANTEYNNGEKLHAEIISTGSLTGRTALDDGRTGTRTINQSPATDVIQIVE